MNISILVTNNTHPLHRSSLRRTYWHKKPHTSDNFVFRALKALDLLDNESILLCKSKYHLHHKRQSRIEQQFSGETTNRIDSAQSGLTSLRRKKIAFIMTSKKRRHSDTIPSQLDDASVPNAIRRADRRSSSVRPQDPGVHADAYYRNLYSVEPDFGKLGHEDPDFADMYRLLPTLR